MMRRRTLRIRREVEEPVSLDPFAQAVIDQIDAIRREHGWFVLPRGKRTYEYLFLLPR